MILPLLVFLAIAIIFHEFGHFLACKLLGIRVEVFSVGFPPKLIGKKWGETEYAISAIPLGGYVKISGQDPTEPLTGAPYEFNSRPLWQRSLVVLTGPIFNILIALVIIYILFIVGIKVSTFSNTIGEVVPQSVAAKAGLGIGDKIININGKETKYWDDFAELYDPKMIENKVTILRPGTSQEFQAILPTVDKQSAAFDIQTDYGLRPFVPNPYVEVELVFPNSIAYRAGFRQGDRILAITNIPGATTFNRIIDGIHHSAKQKLIMQVVRPGQNRDEQNQKTMILSVVPDYMTSEAKFATIGFVPKAPINYIIRHSASESIGLSFAGIGNMIYQSGKFLGDMILGKIPPRKAIGGLQSIAIVAQQEARLGLVAYFSMVAMLSLQLGIFNLIPFPVLDGGHLLFYAIEKIRKKPLSVKTLEMVTRFGVAVLITLMIYFIFNDLVQSGTLAKLMGRY